MKVETRNEGWNYINDSWNYTNEGWNCWNYINDSWNFTNEGWNYRNVRLKQTTQVFSASGPTVATIRLLCPETIGIGTNCPAGGPAVVRDKAPSTRY